MQFSGLKLEFVSLHIPKCGGMSFKEILQNMYGETLQPDYSGAAPVSLIRDTIVVHGHFVLQKYLRMNLGIFCITWIRNPVERIISYYNYWKSIPKHSNPSHNYFIDNKLTLEEFAEYPPIRHELMEGYLEGFDWRHFKFVGILEHFDRDINALAVLLKWKAPIHIPLLNEGSHDREIPASIRSHIEKTHSTEMEFYNYWCANNSQFNSLGRSGPLSANCVDR